MNAKILTESAGSWAEEQCAVRSLSSIIGEVLLLQTTSGLIDLLKVDVEGSELSVLRSVSAVHWSIIRQVVVETSLANCEEVLQLLRSVGFTVAVDQTDRLTGCAMAYAIRN